MNPVPGGSLICGPNRLRATIPPTMKTPQLPAFSPAAALALSLTCLALTPAALHAQGTEVRTAEKPATSVTEETTTRTAVLPDPALTKREGKIDRIDAETNQLMLRTKLGKEPIGFTVNSATKIIDLDGKPVDPVLLKPEVPVELDFAEDGNKLIATRVIVQRVQVPVPGAGMTLSNRETLKPGGKVVAETSRQTTTTTINTGALQKLDDGFITIKESGVETPVRYQVSKSTAWVNAVGEPTTPGVIKAGHPIKVTFSKNGDVLVAEQIAILEPAAPAPAAAVKE